MKHSLPSVVIFLALGHFLVASMTCLSPPASAQDIFSSGDGGDSGSAPGPDAFSAGDGGGPGGPDVFSGGGNPRYRPLPGYTNCGPWYNSYQNFVRAMMQHYAGWCEMRNGNQVWCHERKPGNCNPDAGGQPDSPMMDTGVRYTPDCHSVCDRSVAEGGTYKPAPTTTGVQPPAPCQMPPLEQLAQTPSDEAVAVAYSLTPDAANNIGVSPDADMTPLVGGEVAVALALPSSEPSTMTLSGNASMRGIFVAQDPPLVLHGNATLRSNGTPPQQRIRLKGFATSSLRIPATYKPANPTNTSVSASVKKEETLVLQGNAGTYDPEVGKQRFIAGLLQGMQAELQQLTRYGEVKKAEKAKKRAEELEKKTGQQCEIKAAPSPLFGTTNLKKNPTDVTKFIVDMVENALKNKDVQKAFPHLEMAPIIGPIVSGANFLSAYKDTLDDIVARDTRIRNAMANSPGHDLDPYTVGYLAGQDLADGYNFYVKGLFSF